LSRDAKKKREQRQRAKDGRLMLGAMEIQDRETWIEILEDEHMLSPLQEPRDVRAIRTATERFIADLCREQRRKKADQLLAKVCTMRTGLLERESPKQDSWWLIKKQKPALGRHGELASPPSEEQKDLDCEWSDELEELRASEDDNPETGESRRVNTAHDVEKDT
jgi:hypothetical protein